MQFFIDGRVKSSESVLMIDGLLQNGIPRYIKLDQMLIDGSLTNGFLFVNRGIVVDIDQITNVSTTMIIQPGPVVDFLIANQNVRDPYRIVCAKVYKLEKFGV
ncbi:hypothetical protein FRX31_015482 [Thalictrum thalictroides]|uniref:Uncharacterized protein n=1 Tax=Thalictrum thalictroides TaxID=46969 RepID=A0A7J6WC84_THATH|nr:hypothetical protein FRX31_015482 [Thalictrum thalictroides]